MSVTALAESHSEAAIEAVRSALRTDVIDIFRREIVALRPMTREAAYEAIMSQPSMLDCCFGIFRTKPHLFTAVMVDAAARPVTSPDQPLRCGRTLSDVITLVVRAAARRYFRASLTPRRQPVRRPETGGMTRLARALGLAAEPVRVPQTRVPTAADRLYQAIRNYLCFEWQVPLIPHYTPLSPERVSALGARLLDVREPAELRALCDTDERPDPLRPLLLLDSARRLLAPGGGSVDADILWRVCQQMDLLRLFPTRDIAAMRHAVAQVAMTRKAVVEVLLPVLGSDIRRFTAFLMVAFTRLGEHRFRQVFCEAGQTVVVQRWAERLAERELPPPRLDDMKALYHDILTATSPDRVEAAPQGVSSGRAATSDTIDAERAMADVMQALDRLPSRRMVSRSP